MANAPITLRAPQEVPIVDPQTGKVTRQWMSFFNQLANAIVQGPASSTVTDGAAVLWDGPSGRLVK